jgi:hypothetical protein
MRRTQTGSLILHIGLMFLLQHDPAVSLVLRRWLCALREHCGDVDACCPCSQLPRSDGHKKPRRASCVRKVLANEVVDSPQQRLVAGREAQPPITDPNNGFAWPDTPIGVLKAAKGYLFFASDGGYHARQLWQGEWVGNNKAGSVVTTAGALNNPLGSGKPQDVSISLNPDPSVDPNYSSDTYMGGGRYIGCRKG